MASKNERNLATVAAYAYEVARQQKAWYLKNKPNVKQVHPLFDKLFIASRDAMEYIIKKYNLTENDLEKIKKTNDVFHEKIKDFDLPCSVYVDFVNQVLSEKVNILFQARKGDIEKFTLMNKVLIASDELCNYFDQRVRRLYLTTKAVLVYNLWKDVVDN